MDNSPKPKKSKKSKKKPKPLSDLPIVTVDNLEPLSPLLPTLNTVETARSKYAQLTEPEKDLAIQITAKRFEHWLKHRFTGQIETQFKTSSGSSVTEDFVEGSPNNLNGATRRCLSVPPAYHHGEKYPVNIPIAMHHFLMNGNVFSAKLFNNASSSSTSATKSHFQERKSPRLSLPTMEGALKDLQFSFDSVSSLTSDKNLEEVVALDYSDEEVFVDEQSKADVAGFSKAGRNI